MLSKYIGSGYLLGATPLTIFHRLFWNIADVFSMEWKCACGFGIVLWLFLAHLSQRLTRWAYSIPKVCCPHFQTWISLKLVGQSWSKFMCSITEVGERLHKVLGKIGSKLWFPWQQKAPIDLLWGKRCIHLFSVVFDPILFILAGNEDMHKISNKFEFQPDRTTDYGVSCPWASKTIPIDL